MGSQTNKALKLRIGDKTRDFRLLFISNSEWTDTEFEYWKKMMAQYNMPLPNHAHVQDKEKKIDLAKQHVITDKEIEDMVKEKAKYRSAPVNFATKKTTLLKLRDAAETEGNLDKVSNDFFPALKLFKFLGRHNPKRIGRFRRAC